MNRGECSTATTEHTTEKRKSFDIGVKNSLIDPKHYRAMGDAIWLYLWGIDRVTRERLDSKTGEHVGVILGNVPQRDEDIAAAIGCSSKTIRRWRSCCVKYGYLGVRRTPCGISMWVRRSKKWTKSQKESGQKCPIPQPGNGHNRHRERTQPAQGTAEDVHSNKTIAMTCASTQQRAAVAVYTSLEDLPAWLRRDAKEACWRSFNDWDEPPKNPDAYFAKHWREFARRVVQNHCEDVNTQSALDIQADYGKLSDEETRQLAELNRTRARWKALLQKFNSPETEVRV